MKKKVIRVTTVPVSFTTLLKGQLKFMANYFEMIGISSSGTNNQLDKFSSDENVRTIPIEMTRKITPIQDFKALLKLYFLFRTEKPFLVHSHTPKAGTLSMIAAKFAGVPNRLHTIAGLPLVESKGIKRVILNFVEKITYGCATRILPNSFGLSEIIIDNKFTHKEKLSIIANGSSNGIDTSFFNPNLYSGEEKKHLRENLKIKTNDFIYIFVGRLVTDKGINELICAFQKINTEYPETKLLLVGDYETDLDPLLPNTLNQITENTNIIQTGWVDDVRPYLSISNVLVFPSYREGFPNVVMQSGAMELPSIVTDINGCNEIIKDKVTGLIIPVKDQTATYDAMKAILDLTDKGKSLGINSRKNIVSKYERSLIWEALLKEYNSLS